MESARAAVTVGARVVERLGRGGGVARVGDGVGREIKCVAVAIEHGFDLVRRLRIGRIREGMDGGDHFDLRVALHFARELIEERGLDQRFVALDVDEVRDAAQLFCDLRDPVGAAGVISAR